MVRAFFGAVYRENYVLAADDALLRWQFSGPAGIGTNGYNIKLADVDGRLAGCLGYIPADVSWAGRTLRGAWTANWIVDPAYRTQAIGPQLMRALVREHDVTLVVGASGDARQLLPMLGFTDFGPLRRYVRIVDAEGAAALTGTPVDDWTAGMVPVQDDGGVAVRGVIRFENAIDTVWDAAWGAEGAGTRRSASFLNWRYALHPTFEYRLFQACGAQGPIGLAVYRVELAQGTDLRVGRLVECIAANGKAATALLNAVAADAREQRIAIVDFFCSSARLGGPLTALGWRGEPDLPHPVPMLFQPVTPSRRMIPFLGHVRKAPTGRDIRGIDDWYVTKGDGDQDRPN
jgi:hypothetical protein